MNFKRFVQIVLTVCFCGCSIFTFAVDETSKQNAVACKVGTVKQLFLDDYVIDKMDGLEKVLQQPRRHSNNPIVRNEHPWEGRGLQAPLVFWDADLNLFRMYYWAQLPKKIYTCYATSTDGIHWEKPLLGLHNGPDGSKENNIVLRGIGQEARTRYVARNPYSNDPQKKYVAMYIDNVPGLTEFAAYSPDGLNWTTANRIGDLRGCTGGPPTANPRYFLVEQKWAESPRGRYRGIWRTESQDLKTWGGGKWIIERQADDDPDLEFYHAISWFLGQKTYHGLHLGYYYPFHTLPQGKKLGDGTRMAGLIDTYLMISRDTINWRMIDRSKPFIPCGGKDEWDAGMVFAGPEVVVGDEIRYYYGAWRREHSAETDNTCAIGLATLRLDGFVSVEPKEKEGTLLTKPFVLEGDALVVNVDASRGSLRVEIQDESGKAIQGYTTMDASEIRGDNIRVPVTFNGGNVTGLKGKTVRLSFHLCGARLFAFQLVPNGKKTS
ncbi:MAG: hypothetical protein JXM70_09340 [Pirellulales bacterium]|nr:hypothetical protein [Pirellulales bacterium]